MPLRVKGEWNIVVKRKRSEKNFVFEKKNSSISVVRATKRRMKSKQKSRKQNKGAHTQHFSRVFFFHSSLFFIFRFLLPNYRFHHIAHAHTEESVEQQWAKLQLHERCREWEGERRLRKTNERMNRKQQKRKKPESIPLLSLRRFQCLFLFWI